MTFAELLTEVYEITGRADLVALTKSAVKAATLKAHRLDFFSKDIYETQIKFDDSEYAHSLDIITLIPNYRALKYMRKLDVSTLEAGKFIGVLTPEEILDQWGNTKTDVAYVAGRVIEIKSSTSLEAILIGCYVNPIIVEATYSSWIADLQPWAIVYEAARRVYLSIAQPTEAKGQATLVAEEYMELKINAVTDVGF